MKKKYNALVEKYKEYSNTTIFMLPMLGIPFDVLKHFGFVNAFIGDHEHEVHYLDHIYVLMFPRFTTHYQDFEGRMQSDFKAVEVYDPEPGLVMYVFQVPDDYKKEFELFKKGKYSEFSEAYKNKFFEKDTISYKILHKDDEVRTYWEKRINMDNGGKWISIPPDQEVWPVPEDYKEIFRYDPTVPKQEINIIEEGQK